jgi:hypothetical protein
MRIACGSADKGLYRSYQLSAGALLTAAFGVIHMVLQGSRLLKAESQLESTSICASFLSM